MEFQDYYAKQAKENTPVFRGASFQKGYGFGSVFKRFFKWVLPIIKQNALPIMKTVGKEALKGAVNIANDALDGQDLETSAKSQLKNSLNNLSDQYGNGKKKKKKSKKGLFKLLKYSTKKSLLKKPNKQIIKKRSF